MTDRTDGGFAFLDNGGILDCGGASVESSSALESGGAIYARRGSSIYLNCDIMGSTSPSGAVVYLSAVTEAVMSDMVTVNSVFSCGSGAVYCAEGSALNMTGVTLIAPSDVEEDSTHNPVQIDSTSSFRCVSCTFIGWDGDTVILSQNTENGSLRLDNCDFIQSSPSGNVVSSSSFAEIRNARVDEPTFSLVEDTSSLVDQALSCSDTGVCGTGVCMNSELGVLCECLPSGGCLDDGGFVSLSPSPDNDDDSYSAGDDVTFKLIVEASDDGSTDVLWNISSLSAFLDFTMFPSAGVLPPGRNVTIGVVGSPSNFDVGGGNSLSTTFELRTVGSRWENGTTRTLTVYFSFYLCDQYMFAVNGNDSSFDCDKCLDGSLYGDLDGVDCSEPGSTLRTLNIRRGYWRESIESYAIRECLFSGACRGGSTASSADDYCYGGYEGPCEYDADCTEGESRACP